MSLKEERIVTLGHAVGSETGGHSGKAGNQTGKELRFQPWYDRCKGWSCVIRAKDARVRYKIASSMIDAVNNLHIGYDQSERTTLYREAYNKNWNISAITTDCETDCSALVSVCVNASGICVPKDMWTGNEKELLNASGAFKIYESEKYTESSEKLVAGDILLGLGHTAVVVDIKVEQIIDRTLRQGMEGDDVKAMKKKLKELGLYSGFNNGKFGSKVEGAVKIFQQLSGLVVDGIAGKKTLTALGFKYGG